MHTCFMCCTHSIFLPYLNAGRPQPRLTWWHETTLLDNTSHVLSENRVKNVLKLQKLERRYLNTVYTCQASNNNVTNPITSSVTLDMNCEYFIFIIPCIYDRIWLPKRITFGRFCAPFGICFILFSTVSPFVWIVCCRCQRNDSGECEHEWAHAEIRFMNYLFISNYNAFR